MLEIIRSLRSPIARIEGVLNGTSNFVLDRLAARADLYAAVEEARLLGYAEADPSDDLSGLDAARKLTLIARDALGLPLRVEDISRDHPRSRRGGRGTI